MVDLGLAGEKAGVLPAVLASLTASYPGMNWAELAPVMPKRVTRHGIRRAAEMREAARMLAEMGFSAALSEAIAETHESFARAPADRVIDLGRSALVTAEAESITLVCWFWRPLS